MSELSSCTIHQGTVASLACLTTLPSADTSHTGCLIGPNAACSCHSTGRASNTRWAALATLTSSLTRCAGSAPTVVQDDGKGAGGLVR
jgi:hypothetical protein